MNLIEKAKRIKTIADIGLLYSTTPFDHERYEELRKISLELLSETLHQPINLVESYFNSCIDYPTVKVDVRGFVMNDLKQVLLVKETSDERWSLPGGWAEPGFSPSEAIRKEVYEEAGIIVKPEKLLAVFDIKCHNHPPSPYSIYKIIIHCTAENFKLQKGFDILDADFFDVHNLPPLSINRILKEQIESLYLLVHSDLAKPFFD